MRERISPLKTPALAIQTYEYFSADPKARERAVNAFLAGEADTIPLEYTKLFDAEGKPVDLDEELKMLEDLMRDLRDPEYPEFISKDPEDPEFISTDELSRTAEMTFYTAAYRYSELEFIRVVQELNRPGITKKEMIWAADKYRSLNENYMAHRR